MEEYNLLIDLHKQGSRLGLGGEAQTEQALHLAMVDRAAPLKVADIGCGTGASAVLLAWLLNAHITAVDFLQDILDVLNARAESSEVAERIAALGCSMDNLPFANEEFEIIWSEGAICTIGFTKGVAEWHRFLKAGGLLVASEITRLTDSRPAELQQHWDSEYAECAVASDKIRVLEQHSYSPIGYFVLPLHCWLDVDYQPMQARFEGFLNRNGNSEEARSIVSAEQRDMDLYETDMACVSYGVDVARTMGRKPNRALQPPLVRRVADG